MVLSLACGAVASGCKEVEGTKGHDEDREEESWGLLVVVMVVCLGRRGGGRRRRRRRGGLVIFHGQHRRLDRRLFHGCQNMPVVVARCG